MRRQARVRAQVRVAKRIECYSGKLEKQLLLFRIESLLVFSRPNRLKKRVIFSIYSL